jgi:hypothetical protein
MRPPTDEYQVRSPGIERLRQPCEFALVEGNNADATLLFSVDQYGFNKTHPFGSYMNPIIRITAKMRKPNSEIVWSETEFVSDFVAENDQGQPLDVYQKEPENSGPPSRRPPRSRFNAFLQTPAGAAP